MDIAVFASNELPIVLRVLRTALDPAAPLQPRGRLFLETFARITDCAPLHAEPQSIAAHEVHIEGAHSRKRLVQLAALAVLLGRPVKPSAFDFLQQLSRQLGVRDPVIDVIGAMLAGRPFRARILTMRRAFRAFLKEAFVAEGIMGPLRLLGAMLFKVAVNKNRLWDYKRLGLLPEGTLGREYWKHMTTVGFPFPGEPAGITDVMSFHDVLHLLAEHETTPFGEIQQASFQGGNRREDGFFFVQFAILQFHHGIRLTPVTPAQVDNFDPQAVLWAIHRGALCNVDMTHQWNFWPLMPLPLPEARARIGLPPRLEAGSLVRGAA